MLYKETYQDSNIFEPWNGEKINGISYPLNIAQVWQIGELNAIGLHFPVGVNDPVPANKVVINREVKRVNSVVRYVYTYGNAARPTAEDINNERNRRISEGFVFAEKEFQLDDKSKDRVIGAATLAGFAMLQGAQPGNYKWHGGEEDFVWIANDNTLVKMDAQKAFAFGQAAAKWESAHIFSARLLKETNPVPYNFTDDSFWPTSEFEA